MIPTTLSSLLVSVPVLSMQSVSTDASDSIAFSCCASAPRLASRERSRCEGHGDEQNETLRNQRHHPRDRRVDGMVDADVLLPERGDQHGAERHHGGDEQVEQTVDRALQR